MTTIGGIATSYPVGLEADATPVRPRNPMVPCGVTGLRGVLTPSPGCTLSRMCFGEGGTMRFGED